MKRKSNPCEWAKLRLLEYVRKELPKHEHGRVSEHLRGCAECRQHKRLEVELNRPFENNGGLGFLNHEKSEGALMNTPGLMWVVVGHQDPDEIKDGKCATCGAVYAEWCMKILQQRGANQEDCCKGYTIGDRPNQ